MVTTMLAFSYVFQCTHVSNWTIAPFHTKLLAFGRPIFFFGLGALLGWPFSVAVGIPFVLEEAFVKPFFQNALSRLWNQIGQRCFVFLLVGVFSLFLVLVRSIS
jgi:hypothetical protein